MAQSRYSGRTPSCRYDRVHAVVDTDPGTMSPIHAVQLDSLELTTEARLVGLRTLDPPTLEDVERRRLQLWLLSMVIVLGVTGVMMLASTWPQVADRFGVDANWLTVTRLRMLMGALTAGFAVYTVEKELHLRKLTRLLIEERVVSTALSNRLVEVSALLEAGKAINAVLDLDAVLDIILRSARTLLDAASGSVMLTSGPERLAVVCSHGNDAARGREVAFSDGIAGRVARSWEPLLVSGHVTGREFPVQSAMSVPLLHRGDLLGVLNLNGAPGRAFTEYDLRALSLFAEQAAAAIANARLYQVERERVAELVEGELRKSRFLAAVSHDLRTPLTSLIGCTKMLQRKGLAEETRLELAEMVDRQSHRLNRMIDDLLTAARLEAEAAPALEEVDAGALVADVADEYRVAGWDVRAAGLRSLPVLARPDALRRIVSNLVDNALTHGAAPVVLTVAPAGPAGGGPGRGGGTADIAVRDHGPGIPAGDRERVWERFTRLDPNRRLPGVGLGLSIVQGLVASCGGSVAIDDPPDGGAGVVVRVTLQAA